MSISTPTVGAMVEAILSNSDSFVKEYLKAGIDPSSLVVSPATISSLHKVMYLANRTGQPPSLLHIAVINAYHHCKQIRANESALSIVRRLVKHGADTSSTATNLVLKNVEGYVVKPFDASDKTAAGLALFLKQYPNEIYKAETESMLEKVIEIIQSNSKPLEQLPHTRILKSTADIFEKLFLSEEFSDICFVCSDGVELPAHRNILATASDYFKTSFKGPWAENSQDGKWPTAHSSKVLKPILAFIYQGRIQANLTDLEPLELFAVAAEYDIPSLKTFAQGRCISSIDCDNVKQILQAAHLYDNKTLKQACFSFISQKAAQVLTNPEMMRLATEDAALWTELTSAIAPSSSSSSGGRDKKRARTS